MSDEKRTYNPSVLPEALQTGLGDQTDAYDKKELLNHLAKRISELIERQTDLLFSILYRMDVSEEKIEKLFAGQTDEPISEGLARLIVERQEERVQTRRQYSKGDQSFQWTIDD